MEVCHLELVSFHYQLPTVSEEVLELIPVVSPEPQEVCLQVETAELETECQEEEEEDICVSSAHLRSSRTGLAAEEVQVVRSGDCQERELSLQQRRCELERKVKVRGRPASPPGLAGLYGNQHGPFTAFQ